MKNIYLKREIWSIFLKHCRTAIGVARIFDWGGSQTSNHMQRRHQKFSNEELFVGQMYHKMEDQKPGLFGT